MTWLILLLALVTVVWGWRNPRFLIPLLIIALPLEISRTWFPHLAILDKLGAFVGVIDLGRIFAFALLFYFLYTLVRRENPWSQDWRSDRFLHPYQERSLENTPFWRNPIFILATVYIFYGLVSFFWSVDRLHTLTGVVRLGILWLLGSAVYRLLTQTRDFWLVAQTLAVVSTILAGLGVYQLITKHFFWFGELYQELGRYNATFVDPNLYARFLILGSLATLAWLLMTAVRAGQILGYLALLLQIVALLATGSRTGWLAFVLVFIVLIILVPRKSLFTVLGGGILLGIFMVYKNPEMLNRILDLRQGFWAASTERQYLLKAGWDMFMHHIALGVGLGGFQHMMLTQYAQLIQNGVSLSHTALMTTAAELGIIGLGITLVFFVFLYVRLVKSKQLYNLSTTWSSSQGYSILTIFSVLAVTVIFLSAQGEGRFWEDPMLWVYLGYLTALNNVEGVS